MENGAFFSRRTRSRGDFYLRGRGPRSLCPPVASVVIIAFALCFPLRSAAAVFGDAALHSKNYEKQRFASVPFVDLCVLRDNFCISSPCPLGQSLPLSLRYALPFFVRRNILPPGLTDIDRTVNMLSEFDRTVKSAAQKYSKENDT
jgi:hypothetical protein